MNGMLLQENTTLQNDNKQLSLLLKEYEQTVETIMGKFRKQAVSNEKDHRIIPVYAWNHS